MTDCDTICDSLCLTLCVSVCVDDVILLMSLNAACCNSWITLQGRWRTCRGATLNTQDGWTPVYNWPPLIKVSASLNACPTLFTCQCHQLSCSTVSVLCITYLLTQEGHVIAKESQI